MNLSSFDRAANAAGKPVEDLTQTLDSQLNAVARKHQERLAALQQQYLDEQQKILESKTMKRPQKSQEWPLPIPGETPKQARRRINRGQSGPPTWLALAALAFLLAKVLAG